MMFAIESKEARKGCSWTDFLCGKTKAELAWVNDWQNIPKEFEVFLDSIFLKEQYIQSIQEEYHCSLVLFQYNQKPAGVALFFLSEFYTADWQGGEEKGSWVNWLAKKWSVASQVQKVLLCGNPFISGPHGFSFDKELEADIKSDLLCEAMNEAVEHFNKQGEKVRICMIKDFACYQKELVQELKKCGFGSVPADPIMVLPILSTWHTYEDYTSGLISKFRSKAMTAYKKSAEVSAVFWNLEDMQANEMHWYPLYQQVYEQAENRWLPLTAKALCAMKKRMGDAMVFRAYFWNDRLVGFSVAILDDEMEAHLVGLDYQVNKELYLYSRMLYDFVTLGIEKKVKQIVFGRTAVEIKSALGAMPVQYGNVIRHAQSIPNLFVKWMTQSLNYVTEDMREPWKVEVEKELKDRLHQWMNHE
jgi:hypothetical protein